MVSNDLGNLDYKSIVSTNDKEDFLKKRLERLEIAYVVMSRHPDVLREFVCAVKGGANHPAMRPTAPVEEVVVRRDAA